MYFDTYLASEGFVAFQDRPEAEGMRMVLDVGIYYEFVPFNDKNFDSDGVMVENPQVLNIGEVKEGEEYALLLSTCSGAWRYLIGDVVKFSNLKNYEIIITGRTKHFLSLCGEHLSQDNMNKAIELVSKELNIDVKEFTVTGISFEGMFAHHWYVGTDDKVDSKVFKQLLDNHLKELNDDYKVERIAALKDVIVDILPADTFYEFMRLKGKAGAQNKFPRVLKNKQLHEWKDYLVLNKLQA
jgi:hypothetical protein